MNKHTPGPWQAGLTENGTPTVRGGGGSVCGFDYRDHSRRVADARLIAAAPELLAALYRALDAGIGRDGQFPSPADEVRAAIAKAT